MVREGADLAAAEFIEWCSVHHKLDEELALALEEYLADMLSRANVKAMMVTARAKSIPSIIGKLLRKPYKRPKAQVTDRVGARVIVYHAADVDKVTETLRRTLDIRQQHSIDKRLKLGMREFGYRSYHLVASTRDDIVTGAPAALRGQVFEVQIRSLLEHIWAEIEHDVIYKSGADWPAIIKRRFASMAGVLELLDHEFQEMTQLAESLVDSAGRAMHQEFDAGTNLDVPHMLALLRLAQPTIASANTSDTSRSFDADIKRRLNLALRRTGVRTVAALKRGLESRRFRIAVRRYARAEGIAPYDVSDVALLGLLIGLRRRRLLTIFFPEFADDNSLQFSLRGL
jgi:ppGpp synthetase/RelA/SpoT-type nucleotidyltranferase